jgi:hypothetical protein
MKPYGVQVEAKEIASQTNSYPIEQVGNSYAVNRGDGRKWFEDKEQAREYALGKPTTETIHAVRISPEFKAAVEQAIKDHGGAFALFKLTTEPTEDMVTAVAIPVDVLAPHARVTRRGSVLQLDTLNAYGILVQAMDKALGQGHHWFGKVIQGDETKAVYQELKKMLGREHPLVKNFATAMLTGKPGVVGLALNIAVAEETMHVAQLEALVGETIAGSLPVEFVEASMKLPVFQATTVSEKYGDRSHAIQVHEFATKVIAGQWDDLGIDPDTYIEELVDFMEDYEKAFTEVNGKFIDWGTYAKTNEVTEYWFNLLTEAKGKGDVASKASDQADSGSVQDTAKQAAERDEARGDKEVPADVTDKTFSLHFEKVKDELGLALEGEEYDPITIRGEAQKAFDYIQKHPEDALKIGYGLMNAPAEVNSSAVGILLSESLKDSRPEQSQAIARATSLRFTEAAQELNIAKLDFGAPRRIEAAVNAIRLKKLGQRIPSTSKEEAESDLQKAQTKIKKDATRAARDVNATTRKINSAQSLLESLIC